MFATTLVRMSGRSWWQALYVGGRTLAEWDTVPGIVTAKAVPSAASWRASRWEEVPKQGMVALRLLTPDGRVGELQTNNPEGRFVQLKAGGKSFGGANKNFTDAHIIGVVDDAGKMMCWAWEREAHSWSPNLETMRCSICNLTEKDCTARVGQLGYFTDDVFGMKYRRIGPLSLAVQGVKL